VHLTCIITGLPMGGAEMMLLKLMSRLSPRIERHVISLTSLGEIGPRLRALGIPVEAMEMGRAGSAPVSFARLVVRLRQLAPDVVHTWLYHADLLGGLAARLAGVPALAWNVRTSAMPAAGAKWSTRAVIRACARLSRRLPDRIACCSDAAARLHVSMGYPEQKLRVIPNGIDLDAFRPDPHARSSVRSELGTAGDARLIGLVARLDPQKDHEGFLQAARLLRARCPDVHFVLAGAGVDGRSRPLAQSVARAGLTEVVHLLGARDDIPRLTSALDIASLSSRWGEAFPNVVAEAMACGVPCVVTDVGDSAEIVGEIGLVVPPSDPQALACAWEQLLALPAEARRALGERARSRIAARYDLGQVARQYEAFYSELYDEAERRKQR
jgi:glycosyltransferase involved in cell wall biosynthesis